MMSKESCQQMIGMCWVSERSLAKETDLEVGRIYIYVIVELVSLDHWLSIRSDLSPRRHLAITRDISACHNWHSIG